MTLDIIYIVENGKETAGVIDVLMIPGCFIMNFLVVGGAAKSFGILYVEFVDKYETSSSGTLSIVALSQSLCMLLGESLIA